MESRKTTGISTLLLGTSLILSVVLIGIGIHRATASNHWDILSMGALGLILTIALTAVVQSIPPAAPTTSSSDAKIDALADRLRQATELLARISDQQLLSDRAKSVAFREKDRDALRRAIMEEMNRGDWDAALRLADEIEGAFGYKAEAARFRDEVRARRQEVIRRQIQEVSDVIDRHVRAEQWNAALREADRLIERFPDSEQARGLPAEIDRRRQEHKRRLLDSWNEAVQRHDVDGSIEILKQLDAYLTPAEAASMQDSVRSVFKEKRDQLGKVFADAVRDHKWIDAIKAGEMIVREFPESRMAQEVKEKMPVLRQRAAENGNAAAILPPMTPAGVS